jgi:Cu/Ag efflux pump CusA
LALAITAIPVMRLGGEFMPPLDEGDLLYMPSALPGISVSKAAELLQQTDRLIKTVPEVQRVFGKAGRADTATDPAPLEMFETTIQFKPREQWRPGMTPEKLVEELDRVVKVPGLSNVVPPSATASTCWPPASRAPSASRSPDQTSPPSTSSRHRLNPPCAECLVFLPRWPNA